MRGSTRLLLLKLGAVLVPLAGILAAMHFLLPGLARRREQEVLGKGYERVETKGLRLWVPRGSGIAPPVAGLFESFAAALYAQYGQPLSLQPIKDKVTIRLFASHGDLVAYASREMRRDLSYAGGFYDPASWSIALTAQPPPTLLPLIFHEATHLFMDRSATLGRPEWSLWLAEGMAVFFEKSSVVNGRFHLGGASRRDIALVLAAARQGRLVALSRLLRGGPELFHSELGALCYAEAGLLAGYLLVGDRGKHRDAFFRYVELERRPGPCPPQALESCLNLSPDDLQKQWLAYLQRMLP
jgi:hypothetical protein